MMNSRTLAHPPAHPARERQEDRHAHRERGDDPGALVGADGEVARDGGDRDVLAMEVSRMFMNTARDTPSVSNARLKPVMGVWLAVMPDHRQGHVAAFAVADDDGGDELLGAG